MSSERLDFVLAWLRAEEERPSARSREIVQKLRELDELCRQSPVERRVDPRLERARALLQDALSQPWTVTRLAKSVGMSRAQLARRFAAAFGTTPGGYLHERRMTRARALLAVTDDSLSDIALSVGYESEFAFNRAFRRHHGLPPGAYRRLVRASEGSVTCLRRAA